MLAQLADLFDESTWIAILVVGMGLPMVAMVIALLRRRRELGGEVAVTVFYYLLVAGGLLGIRTSAASFLLCLGLSIAGPVLALVTVVRSLTQDEADQTVRAFPVLPKKPDPLDPPIGSEPPPTTRDTSS